MTEIYCVVVGFMLLLAVFTLFVGVSNDAVNFLNNAIGAKVATFKTVMIVASLGVLAGAIMSEGMMDVARHGILLPSHYSFAEVMTVFLAVMVANVVILDVFNSLGMPTSTTVSLVFALLGATFVAAVLKMVDNDSLSLSMLMNSDKALGVVIAIFLSVAIAFVVGSVVQWVLRMIFTFNYKKYLTYFVGVFGGVAFTSLSYFILIKGVGNSPFISDEMHHWINANTPTLLLCILIATAIISQILHALKVNILRIIVLLGTFSLAMAFAGNDLVNFIGVPLAALDSLLDFINNGNGDADTFLMTSLEESAKSPILYLMLAGIIMIISMATSKKAQGVIKTSVDLARQDEGDEMFGSSHVARTLVRASQSIGDGINQLMPRSVRNWIESRFNKEEAIIAEGAAFDEVRAAVNLVLAAMLIIMGTNLKLPLSTTYVTFMVAMGSSLADRAWSRESAVFRITGVLSVIGGWFITAGIAFAACALVYLVMYYGGVVSMFLFMALTVYLLWRSNRKYESKTKNTEDEEMVKVMLRSDNHNLVWKTLSVHFAKSQTKVIELMRNDYLSLVDSIEKSDLRTLRRIGRGLKEAQHELKRNRRVELVALRRSPIEIAIEKNTWFHLAQNSNQQYIYCLKRILDPVLEHVDNGFEPMPRTYMAEYSEVLHRVQMLIDNSHDMMQKGMYKDYHPTMDAADALKGELSRLRKMHIDRIQREAGLNLTTSQLYLNLLQETQELLSIMRHQLRSTKRFVAPTT